MLSWGHSTGNKTAARNLGGHWYQQTFPWPFGFHGNAFTGNSEVAVLTHLHLHKEGLRQCELVTDHTNRNRGIPLARSALPENSSHVGGKTRKFPGFVLLLHRHVRRFSLLVRRETRSLGRASKLFSHLFYTSIFLKSRRCNTTAVSFLLSVFSLLVMSELLDQFSS